MEWRAECGFQGAKRRSRPLSRDESACLRGATHVRSDAAPSGPSGAGRGPRPSPGPLVGPSPVRLAVGAFSRGRPLCSGGVDSTCPVRAVMPHDSIPKQGKSQWGSDGDVRGQGTGAAFPHDCRGDYQSPAVPRPLSIQAVNGLVLGLTISRQSRSPRAPPGAAHRAGTPEIYNAVGRSEFRRPSAA